MSLDLEASFIPGTFPSGGTGTLPPAVILRICTSISIVSLFQQVHCLWRFLKNCFFLGQPLSKQQIPGNSLDKRYGWTSISHILMKYEHNI